MRGTILLLITVALALLLGGGVAASKQLQEQSTFQSPTTTTTQSTSDVSAQALPTKKASFTSGSGATYLHIEVSDHGNLLAFESPQGQVQTGTEEGYAVCSGDSSFTHHGYDIGSGIESGFGTPTFAQPNGAGTFPLTVTRNTTDGKFQLKQVWAKPDATEKDITVTMTLKNRSSSTINTPALSRTGDFQVGATASDWGARTDDSAFQWDDHSNGPDHPANGLQLTALTFATKHLAFIQSASLFNDPNIGATTCSPATDTGTPTTAAGDWAMKVNYVLGNLSAGASESVKYEYSRM